MARSTKRQYAINTASGMVEQFTRIAMGFVLVPYLMWRLGLKEYGFSTLAQSALVFFGFLQLGLGPTLIRFCSQAIARKDEEEIRKVSSTAQVMLGLLGAAGMIGILGFIPAFIAIYNVPEALTFGVSMLLACMAITFFLNFILVVPQGLAMGSNRYDLMNIINTGGNILRLGLIVVTFELYEPSLSLLGICFLVTATFRMIAFYSIDLLILGRIILPSLRCVNKKTFKDLFGFSMLNLINSVAAFLVVQGPLLIMGRTLGPEITALFFPATLVASSMQGVLAQISAPLVPMASQAQVDNNLKKAGSWSIMIASFIAVVGLAIALPLCVFGHEVVQLWLGENKAYIWNVIAIMAVAAVLSQTGAVNYSLAMGGGCIRPHVYSLIILGVIIVSSVAVETYFLGWELFDVAVGIVLCQCCRNVFYLTYAYSKQFFYSVSAYFKEVYGKPFLVFTAVAGMAWGMKLELTPDSLLLLVAEIAVTMLIYGIVAWYFLLPATIKKNLFKLIPGLRAFG